MKVMRIILLSCLMTVVGIGRSLSATYYSPLEQSFGQPPNAVFRSTSVYAPSNNNYNSTPLLTAEGTVDEGVYLSSAPSGPRRGSTPPPPGPTPDPNSQLPIGDGLWVLMVLAMMFACVRVIRTRRS